MEKHEMTIPYIAYESILDKGDRQHKRMIIVIIVLIFLLLATNLMWLIAWNQYDYVDDYVEVDGGDGIANYIGDDGDFNYGTNSTQAENEDTF